MSIYQVQPERLFLSSLVSPYTKNLYMIYLQKYLKAYGYRDLNDLADKGMRNPKQVENEIIELIIKQKEKGTKRGAISNYTKSIIAFCKINDIVLNTNKIRKFMPSNVRSKKTNAYSHSQIQKMLDIADERMRAVILLLCSSGQRIGSLPNLSVSSMKEVGDLYKITVYENELEEYITFCTPECRKIGIDPYLQMRERYGETIDKSSPLIREQFDRKDQFAIPHPRRVKEPALARKLVDLAEAAGIRTPIQLTEGQMAASVRKDVPVCNGFRRFFSTQLVNANLITEHRWLLEGHNLKGNDSSYVRVSEQALVMQYEMAIDYLTISEENRLRKKVQKLEIEKGQLDRLAAEIELLKQKIK